MKLFNDVRDFTSKVSFSGLEKTLLNFDVKLGSEKIIDIEMLNGESRQEKRMERTVRQRIKLVSVKIFDTLAVDLPKFLPKKAIKFTKWYFRNLPTHIPQAAIISSLYVFVVFLFFGGNPLTAIVGGLVLGGSVSIVHSLSLPFIKSGLLTEGEREQKVMSIGLWVATVVVAAVIVNVAISFLSFYFPILAIFEINYTFTIPSLIVVGVLRVFGPMICKEAYKVSTAVAHTLATL